MMIATPVSPTPDQPSLDLEQFLPYRISVLSNRISSNIARVYGERYGMAVTEWRVMAVLALYPGLSAGEVSERTAMDKVAVSRAVARLLERGFIHRETHGDDRRRSVLHLTHAGVEVYHVVAPMVLECERRLLAPFNQDEQHLLHQLIDRLATEGLASMTGR
ncbi:MarR family transcriptional regulator [Xanthomonas sp. MUS 060]|uniref:MarR family winged helix-turn-helix transcriptional regulator n=1 Tax=Xanthomonas sp. MUS 060 TaxID=1588031 RepID=UPI0005F2909C|nr:MarR family transcriptional regulator [Xanthomonas sp. MUS 060]